MPTISKKGRIMPASPIRKLVPYAEAAKKRGTKVYHLNIGQPDIKSPEIAMDAVAHHSLEILAYTRSEGSFEYREKISNYYKKNNKSELKVPPSAYPTLKLWIKRSVIPKSGFFRRIPPC